jgi:hypothetical protein
VKVDQDDIALSGRTKNGARPKWIVQGHVELSSRAEPKIRYKRTRIAKNLKCDEVGIFGRNLTLDLQQILGQHDRGYLD